MVWAPFKVSAEAAVPLTPLAALVPLAALTPLAAKLQTPETEYHVVDAEECQVCGNALRTIARMRDLFLGEPSVDVPFA